MADTAIQIVDKCANTVFQSIGAGLSENVYRNAICIELRKLGHKVECEYSSPVFYEGENVGMIRADLIIDDVLCVEFKTKQSVTGLDINQAAKYERHIEKVNAAVIINFTASSVQVLPILATLTRPAA